ncbi:MAG: TlpA family protein disulfide reductase [Dermatophilaceae bacterium]|nr:TlpA family protein disulfide reductase [Dermatophilaceae bacterium]
MSRTGRRAALLSVVVVAVLGIVALLASGLAHDPKAIASPLVGRTAPDFRLEGIHGSPVQLSHLKGQVVVVNFWASWCAECRTEQQALNQTWSDFRDSGVVVLGVNFQDQRADAEAYLASSAVTYPNVEDTESRTALAYGLRGVPETFVVDRDGHIVDRVIGPVDAGRLGATLNTLTHRGTP